eukprot:CAMPEP_0197691246 /NCGR_PEP_ID=MMETSP1338-20131121/109450_1 /TAXON_ID=43686 ORGANISM="Pelagodinium beii, Strain RCC1491" /NCGR_SAMPLE_ID=MMETSP1338 /ASSEMBLY_ACC=CAM_ASM_000754 /LENGTH=333 /DNA_ID=CAMNT_0043273775 /DNA_START=22 /DNA_END=1020 /DNA_ORIENTATION=-
MTSLRLDASGCCRKLQTHNNELTGHSQCGFLFDVTAKHFDVAVSAVSFMPGVPEGEYDIWTAQEKHELVHQNLQAWTPSVKGVMYAGPLGEPLRAVLPQPMQIPAGLTHSFYISGNNVSAVCFSTECKHAHSGENSDIVVHLGHFKAIPWEGVLSTGPFGHNGRQEFIGTLEYQVTQSVAADQVAETTSRLWEKRLFSDAEVVATNGARFAVHRSVLAATSTVFEAAFQNLPMGEDAVLKIDASEDTVEALLRFVYIGSDMMILDPGEMLKTAHLYGLPVLAQTSATHLASHVDKEHAVDVIRALRPYKDFPHCQAAWRLMLQNLREQLISDD